jgi:hypothetical protein
MTEQSQRISGLITKLLEVFNVLSVDLQTAVLMPFYSPCNLKTSGGEWEQNKNLCMSMYGVVILDRPFQNVETDIISHCVSTGL